MVCPRGRCIDARACCQHICLWRWSRGFRDWLLRIRHRRDSCRCSYFLQSKVDSDYENTTRYVFPSSIDRTYINLAARLGNLGALMPRYKGEMEGLQYCLTHIVDGEPFIAGISDDLENPLPDYLKIYMTDAGFDFPSLIDDDFVDAVRLLWVNKKYYAALKLLLSVIDTIGFIDFGPEGNCFVKWLDRYCNLATLEITSGELWELRNSLLHMSNLESRRVKDQTVRRLIPVITATERDAPDIGGTDKSFHVLRFIKHTFVQGIENWLQTYNETPGKFLEFVMRYDTIVSETRMSEWEGPGAL